MTSEAEERSGFKPLANGGESSPPLYDVFLSYNSDDKRAVEVIGVRLRSVGLTAFLDKWHLKPGGSFQSGLLEALNASACFAFFVGQTGRGLWHNEEMQYALNKAVRTRDDYRVIPVVLPGGDPSDVGGFVGLRTLIDFRPGLDDEDAFCQLVAGIKGVAPDSDKGLFDLPDTPRPYSGIKHFDYGQHGFYFGRDAEVQRLTAQLEKDRFVVVVGGSGSGKSSLVRAGLCTDAAEKATSGIRNWHRVVFMPGKDPLLELAANLAAHLPEGDRLKLVEAFTGAFITSGRGLTTALATLFPNRHEPVLLLVDQFEELFTQRPVTSTEQAAWRGRTACFATNLRSAVDNGFDWLRIIVTLRADFLDRFVSDEFPDFRALLERRQFWVTAMTRDDIREVIVRPAAERGAYLEKGLVERILSDVHGQATALPLLEEAMDIMWEKRRGPWLTHQAYTEIGGVEGALADKADRVFDSLSESQQIVARRFLLKLIQLGEGSRDTGRRMPFAELTSVSKDPEDFLTVLDSFSGARLISLSANPEEASDVSRAEKTAELAHEALIDHWGRLVRWLDQSRDDMLVDRRLAEAAHRWDDEAKKTKGKPGGLLWRPPELELGIEFLRRSQGTVSELQRRFLERSRRAEKARRLRGWSVVLGAFFPLVLGGAYLKRTAELNNQKQAEIIRRKETELAYWKTTRSMFADLLSKSGGIDSVYEQARQAVGDYQIAKQKQPESLDAQTLREWARKFSFVVGLLEITSPNDRKAFELVLNQSALDSNLLGLEQSPGDLLFARCALQHAYRAAELRPMVTELGPDVRYEAYLLGLVPGRTLVQHAAAEPTDLSDFVKLLRRLGTFAEKTKRLPEARQFWAECRDVANKGIALAQDGSYFNKLFREDVREAEQELERLSHLD